MPWARLRVDDANPLGVAHGNGAGEVARKQFRYARNPVIAHATMLAVNIVLVKVASFQRYPRRRPLQRSALPRPGCTPSRGEVTRLDPSPSQSMDTRKRQGRRFPDGPAIQLASPKARASLRADLLRRSTRFRSATASTVPLRFGPTATP